MFYSNFKLIIYSKFSLHLFFMQQRNITLSSSKNCYKDIKCSARFRISCVYFTILQFYISFKFLNDIYFSFCVFVTHPFSHHQYCAFISINLQYQNFLSLFLFIVFSLKFRSVSSSCCLVLSKFTGEHLQEMVKHYWAGSSNHLHIFFKKIHLWKSCFKVASSWLLQLFVKFLFMNNADEL